MSAAFTQHAFKLPSQVISCRQVEEMVGNISPWVGHQDRYPVNDRELGQAPLVGALQDTLIDAPTVFLDHHRDL